MLWRLKLRLLRMGQAIRVRGGLSVRADPTDQTLHYHGGAHTQDDLGIQKSVLLQVDHTQAPVPVMQHIGMLTLSFAAVADGLGPVARLASVSGPSARFWALPSL